ncbi:MAG: mycobactin polyketide synthase MbtD [Mycolicibacterium cosmeticum]|nr:mycobactin polyketide synthase MbtD [Mycolicibacterium cosmeticum]
MTLPDGRFPVLLSAHAEDLITQGAAAILRYLERRPELTDVAAVAATALGARRIRKHRTVVRAADIGELTDALGAIVAGQEHPLVVRAAGRASEATGIAFVFPGQGSQWPSMGIEAYDRLSDYRAEVDRCAEVFVAAGHASPLDYLLAEPGSVTNDFSQVQIQGAQFVHGVALARVWRSCGVLPDITVGHSLGEIGAAYIAGTITLTAAVGVVAARATLLDRLTGPYRVAVLGLGPTAAQEAIAAVDGWAELSVVNSNSSVAVSGDTATIAALVGNVSAAGIFAREIEMWFPAHTTKLDAARAELETLLPAGEFVETPVQFIGSATASVVGAATDFADYWYTNLRSTVRFDRAIAAAVANGARTFVELSAHPALLYALGDILDDRDDLFAVGSGRREEPIVDQLAANITAVAVADPGYRWADQTPSNAIALRDFPFAPMRAEHLWAAPAPLPPVPGVSVAVEHWLPHAPAPSTRTRRAAILDLDGGSALGDDVTAAVATRLEIVAPADADLLIVVAPALQTVDAVAAADELAARIDSGVLGYADSLRGTDRAVWLITAAGEQVDPDSVPLPGQAALGAVHRSLALEFPDHQFGHLDLPSRTMDPAALDILLGPAGEFAIRDGFVHRRATRDEPISAPAWTVDSGVLDEVVITGGGGVVGMALAHHLAEQGARRIILLTRHGVDPAQLAELGTEVIAPRCDIADPAALATAIAEIGMTAASLVIHAAGAATIAEHRQLTGAAFADTVSAKVAGFDRFAASWPMRSDVRILLCSSVSGLWGGSGHIAYAAANRLLDVQAAQQRARGRRCTAVRWGLWPGSGIIDDTQVARVQRSGLLPMIADRAAQVSLRDWAGDPLVFTADPDRLRTFLGGEQSAEIAVALPAASVAADDPAGAVRTALGAVLKVADTSSLDLAESLLDLGVDSLLALDLRKKLTQATGHKVPLAKILGGITGTELIEHLIEADKESTVA